MYMKIHYKQNGKIVTEHKGIKPLADQDHLFLLCKEAQISKTNDGGKIREKDNQ